MTTRQLMGRAGPRVTHKPIFKLLSRPEPDDKRRIGFGAPPDMARIKSAQSLRQGLGDFANLIRDSVNCPLWNMPVIEQVRWTLGGPLLDFAVTKSFGAEIDLFGSDKNPEGIDFVETTMAQVGELQTHTLTCAIGFHLEPEPLVWTASGNAWTHPISGESKPPSPDVFTVNDLNNGALGAAFVSPGDSVPPAQIMVPAFLEWGWWAQLVAWHMVRGYDLRWRIGQHTNIMDEVLRHTAYMPPNAQEGSASDSLVDIIDFVLQANSRYDELGTALDFLPIDFIRLGSIGGAAPGGGAPGTPTGPNLGIFRPNRDEQRVGATYGGMDLRSLLGNTSEFRKLALPYVIKAGVPIGLVAQENDTVEANMMRRYLSITQGAGGAAIPPLLTADGNIIAGPTATGTGAFPPGNIVALERNFDTPAANVPQQMFSETAIFKGGELKISLMVKGFEVDEDWYNVLANNKDLRDVVMCECGCAWAKMGG